MKKKFKLIVFAVLTVVLIMSLVACNGSNKAYLEEINEWSFWDNDSTESLEQTAIYDIAKAHMLAGEVEGYEGKDKKVLIMGFDGARADTLINVFRDTNNETNGTKSPNNLYNTNVEFSALNELAETGGVYHMYTGGEDESTKQFTSTAPGWASMLTGVWGEGQDGNGGHGVVNNGADYPLKKDTLMMEFAKKGYKTSFSANWGDHWTAQYVNEVQYIKDNPEVDMTYTRSEDPKKFVDQEIRDDVISKIDNGTDIIFNIFEVIDSNGHNASFDNSNPAYVNSFRSSDNYAYQVLEHLKVTPNYDEEDWLIIMSTDHGGIKMGHGGQTLEERNVYLVSNKVVDTKYYSTDYDGYIE